MRSETKKKSLKVPIACSCVYEPSVRICFSGWFVEPHLRAVCLWKIERWLVVGASSFFSFSSAYKYYIVPVAFGALVAGLDYHSNDRRRLSACENYMKTFRSSTMKSLADTNFRRLLPIKGLIGFIAFEMAKFASCNHVSSPSCIFFSSSFFSLVCCCDENIQLFCARVGETRIENFMLMIAPATRIVLRAATKTLYRVSVSIPPFAPRHTCVFRRFQWLQLSTK